MWSKRINVSLPFVKGFSAGVYVGGSKRINVLYFILSDNSLEYYFQRSLQMWSNIINVSLPLVKGFSAGVYVDGHIEIMLHYPFIMGFRLGSMYMVEKN